MGKFVWEIREMPQLEFMRYQIYYGRLAQRKEIEAQKAQQRR